MRIGQSRLLMASSHSLVQARVKAEKLSIGAGVQQPRRSGPSSQASSPPAKAVLLQRTGVREVVKAADPLDGVEPGDRIRIMLLERLLGIKIRIIRPRSEDELVDAATGSAHTSASPPGPQVVWQAEYETREVYQESEQMSFTARGVFNTADGKQINFSIQVNLSRAFRMESSFTARFGNMPTDPLVINYAGNAAEIAEGAGFRFDLDLDGQTDLMPLLKRGSGFLALDRNGDGAIGDGSELFGPVTGDGFAELRAHDMDQNRWIDENDPVYQHLRIWTRDADGTSRLFALGELGVGAIFLDALKTPFSMKDAVNQTTAQVRQMSVYAKTDDGGVGTVQQLDVILK